LLGGGGGGGAGGLGAELTTAVCADVAAAEPFLFDAVTITRRVYPTSAVDSSLVEVVALIAPQFAPFESHRSHRYAYLSAFPVHLPVVAVSVFGTMAVPLTEGGV
jgi:hypothetical protein